MQLYLPNRKLLSHYFLPNPAVTPAGSPLFLPFVFPALTDLQVDSQSYSIKIPAALISFTGSMIMSDNSAAPGFRVQITQQHGGAQRLLGNREVLSGNALGSGQKQFFNRALDLLDIGDRLVVEVKSLANVGGGVTSRVEVNIQVVQIIGAA